MKYTLMLFLGLMAFGLFSTQAHAQLNNKPFSFKGTPDGGVGMSIGGQQALINQKILGTTPDNLLRDAGGKLLDVTKGPGGAAIVSKEGNGGFLPKYKGTSFKGTNLNISVGVFNAYFSPRTLSGGVSRSATYENLHSGAVINSWTARVTSGGAPVSYVNDSIDTWTAMAQTF